MSTENEAEQAELEALQKRATQMGITYHPNTGLEKLRNKVNAKLNAETEDAQTTAEIPAAQATKGQVATKENPGSVPVETKNQRHARLRKEASRQIRIRVTCMNPNKKLWEGEFFTASNSVVGTHKKYVPFNNTEGWHVPKIIYNMIKEREFQGFVTKKGPNGVKTVTSKLMPEFAVEVMDKLSTEELEELAVRQAVGKNID